MKCSYCGQIISGDVNFCKFCGNEVVSTIQVGYSSKINDPAFKQYLSNTSKWACIFSAILAIIAVVGFFIAGETSRDFDNPQALFIGMAIGAMFLIIGLGRVLSRKRSKTWDGQVVDKAIKNKRKKVNTGDNESYWQNYILYIVYILRADGKRFQIRSEDDDTQYNYYHINDHVRHHGGLDTYEKMDKSKDSIIFCNACATLNDIHDDFCHRCKCPLLK